MAIFLVQHGVSRPKEEDPQRGLSAEGERKVRLIAEVARNYRIEVERIEHSGKRRAEQTAEIMAEELAPPGGASARQGIAPLDDVVPVAGELEPGSNTMLVGHLPFMERLVSQLATGTTDFRPLKFQNGGIICLDRDEDHPNWYVKWALMPDIG